MRDMAAAFPEMRWPQIPNFAVMVGDQAFLEGEERDESSSSESSIEDELQARLHFKRAVKPKKSKKSRKVVKRCGGTRKYSGRDTHGHGGCGAGAGAFLGC